jgi:nuclear transport factor 2 (NTF2) superfamily protein
MRAAVGSETDRAPATRSDPRRPRSDRGLLAAQVGRELDYALRKDLWAFSGNRIAVRFQYECRDASGQWWRSYGNEQWEFDEQGYMRRREASINDVRIEESDRRIAGSRPESERGASLPLCGVAGEPCAVMNGSYRAHPQATRPRAAK